MGARAHGLGNITACISDEWAVFNNIGALSKVPEATAAFCYDMQPTLATANRMAAVFTLPISHGALGAGIFNFGDALYNERIVTLGLSNTLGITSLGAKLSYTQYNAQGFGTTGVISFSIGSLTQLTPKLSVGAHVVNVNQPKLSHTENERLPTYLIVGFGYSISEKVFVTAEIEKNLYYNTLWKSGIEYKAFKKIYFRTGINIGPAAGFFGLTARPKKFILDYAYRYQINLGASHQASVAYKFKRS
jgi:hypothetical protein